MAFLTFIGICSVCIPDHLINSRQTRFIRGYAASDRFLPLGLFVIVLDAFIYSRLGYHFKCIYLRDKFFPG